MSVIKMRCNRVSTFDQGGQKATEVSLVSTGLDGAPLNPADSVTYANFSGTFVGATGAAFVHDAAVDVTIAAGVAADAEAAPAPETPAAKEVEE